MVQFERSAGIFKAGIFKAGVFMAISGPIVSALGAVVAAPNLAALSTGNPNRGALVIGALIAILGALMAVASYIMILVAVYRALVKIDALPVRQPSRSAATQSTPVARYEY
ncbi:hypothetical protein ACSVHC_16010 [Arthrobacter sp. KNU-44]|uniref:hypothetical protein n=1 Tax=unclassified Arthrobacter TaxID=235627 RepID=UPI003F42D475